MWTTLAIIGAVVALMGICAALAGGQADDARRRTRLYEQAKNLFPNLDELGRMEAMLNKTIRRIKYEHARKNFDVTELEEDLVMLKADIEKLSEERKQEDLGYEARPFVSR